MAKICKSSILTRNEYDNFVKWANANLIKFRCVEFKQKYIISFNMNQSVELITFARLKWNLEIIDTDGSQVTYEFTL